VTGEDVVFLILGLGWMCGTLVSLQWWNQARTIWLNRLSARGRLTGTYTPAPSTVWGIGNVRWLLRQRVTISDLVQMGKLEDAPDEDRVTEAWRVRTVRRSKFMLTVGGGGLILVGVAWAVYGFLGWRPFVVGVVVIAAATVFLGRSWYRRVRAWGDFGADLIP
jgi:hypothetical protein